MNARNQQPSPLLEEADGPIVVGIINQIAEAFDGEALSLEAALLLHWITERIDALLWRQYPNELLRLARARLAAADGDDDDESGGGPPEGESTH